MNYLRLTCCICLLNLNFTALAQEPVEPAINAEERVMVEWLEARDEEMLALLERITNMNSGSLNSAGLDAVAAVFDAELRELGFSTSRLPGELIEMPSCPGSNYSVDLADHLLARRPGSGGRFLLMGHIDTVFPPDSPFQTFRREGDTIYGPGVADMKGGLVVMLYALKALAAADALDEAAFTVLLNSDEEMGSLSSRKYIEEEALNHDWGLVYESSGIDTMTRQRKGIGQARLVIHGRAAHSGGAHEQGLSAIKELAYKIVEIENMTDYETGLTVNVGVVDGGEARNTISPCAEALMTCVIRSLNRASRRPSAGGRSSNRSTAIRSTAVKSPLKAISTCIGRRRFQPPNPTTCSTRPSPSAACSARISASPIPAAAPTVR